MPRRRPEIAHDPSPNTAGNLMSATAPSEEAGIMGPQRPESLGLRPFVDTVCPFFPHSSIPSAWRRSEAPPTPFQQSISEAAIRRLKLSAWWLAKADLPGRRAEEHGALATPVRNLHGYTPVPGLGRKS